jgi:hypothetical protein
MVNFVRLDIIDEIGYLARIREIAIMKEKPCIRVMRILIEMIDSASVKGTGTADKTMDFVAF